MMNQPFEGAAAAAAAEVVDKNRNNFSHTTPKELRTVAKDAESRWEDVPRKSALESKIHKWKSGFDQWGVDEEKRETHTRDIQSTGRRIDSRVRSNDYWWYDRNAYTPNSLLIGW